MEITYQIAHYSILKNMWFLYINDLYKSTEMFYISFQSVLATQSLLNHRGIRKIGQKEWKWILLVMCVCLE